MTIKPDHELQAPQTQALRVTRGAGVCLGNARFGKGGVYGDGISRDPLDNAEIKQGPNLYEFVMNNPITKFDVDGRGVWKFDVLNTYRDHSPYVSVSYTLDDNEKRCCKSFHIDRLIEDNGKWRDDNTSPQDRARGLIFTPDETYTNTPGGDTAFAISDAPNVSAFLGFVRYSHTFHFKWKAICDNGALENKILSEITKDYTTSAM